VYKWRITTRKATAQRLRMAMMTVSRHMATDFVVLDGDTHDSIIVSHKHASAMMMYYIKESEFCDRLVIQEFPGV
jgi:hypothetical protein